MRNRRILRTFVWTGAALAIAAPSCIPVSAPSATGSFIACYKESGGDVRFVNSGETCDAGEKQATWNQPGPQGPQGPQGAQGPQGVPGINGNGPAYRTSVSSFPIPATGTAEVARLTLEAGKYSVSFSGHLSRSSGVGNALVYCWVTPLTGNGGRVRASSSSVWDFASLSFQVVVDSPGGLLSAFCYSLRESGSTATFAISQLELSAVKITEIVEQ